MYKDPGGKKCVLGISLPLKNQYIVKKTEKNFCCMYNMSQSVQRSIIMSYLNIS